MNKQEIGELLTKNYQSFINYINDLTPQEYAFSYQQKWSAAQQLEHIVSCVKPLVQVFSMDKLAIEQNFGVTDKPSRSYDVLIKDYSEKLDRGGKAPNRYVPETVLPEQRKELSNTLKKMIIELCTKIETFTEQELDTLCIPHPLLGNLTLREMLYNAAYHVQHHEELAKQNINER